MRVVTQFPRLAELLFAVLVVCSMVLTSESYADANNTSLAKTLITGARIFDGKSDKLTERMSVLVEGNKITKIAESISAPGGAVIIDAGGRTLMPGMIDVHTHMMHTETPYAVMFTAEKDYLTLYASKSATRMLMRGFTSVRDTSGPTFGLKRAIDEDLVPGPRIWPSGTGISQTSGHGDFRSAAHDLPAGYGRDPHWVERYGWFTVADGRAQVLQTVRENLMKGASHIKLMSGGGVGSSHDPLDVSQYTEDELRAAVEAAVSWNTYVTVHAITPAAIQLAIRSGVKCIEHAQLIDEETVKMAVEEGVWLSLQPLLLDEDAVYEGGRIWPNTPEGDEKRRKLAEVTSGTDNAYRLAKKHGAKIAWGTDIMMDSKLAAKQGKQLAKMTRWFSPFELLKMATFDNAQLLALSGPRSPYVGELGVVKEGALADLLLVEGNPLEDIQLITDPEQNFKVIIKDGKIYKNIIND